ncbi:MAG TPA: hypothetical protein VNH18_30935 [Bryobacteraceae bacterium]|nr:hypothetical protein [Bryobacteraceae bacterium]HXJ43740.1 hypothetical protein [Bryobacteraceae bacterium]
MGNKMPCESCEELELCYLNRTEDYINLVELRSQLFRNGEAKVGRGLDAKITEAKAARAEALRELGEHQASHQPPL